MQHQPSKGLAADELSPFVYLAGNEIKTDSRKVAEVFGKRHRDIMRSIRNLKIPNEFRGRNFARSDFIDKNGENQEVYEMTKNGFILLVMGFTGKEAMLFKIAYIEAFDKMCAAIEQQYDDLVSEFLYWTEKESESFALASSAGRVLQKRKGDKKENISKMAALKEMIQPCLFDGNKNGALNSVTALQNSMLENPKGGNLHE